MITWHKHNFGAPVLCLHGFLGTHKDWPAHLPAVDLPGHGKTTVTSDDDYTLDTICQSLNELIKKPLHLIGYSMGGRIALHFALTYPEKVSKLTLISTSPGIEDPKERQARWALDQKRAKEMLKDYPKFLDKWYSQSIFTGITSQPNFQEIYKHRLK